MVNWFRSRPKLSIFLGILAGIIILLFIFARKPFSLRESFTPNPAKSYEEALARIEAIQAEEANLDLHAECATQLQSHGEKTDTVIVFLHGFTSCPAQFVELGQEYYNRGYNVFIPRAPRHGFNDRRGESLKGLTAEEMAAFAHLTADRLDDLRAAVPRVYAPQPRGSIEDLPVVVGRVVHALGLHEHARRLLELPVGGEGHPERVEVEGGGRGHDVDKLSEEGVRLVERPAPAAI